MDRFAIGDAMMTSASAVAGSAMASHLLGRDDQAITALKKALDIDPDFAYAAYLLGQFAYAQGDLDLAIKSYERALKIQPGNAGAYKQLEDWKKEPELHSGFTSEDHSSTVSPIGPINAVDLLGSSGSG